MSGARPAWFRWGAAWILAANLADLILTLWGLRLQAITEANPLIARLLAVSPVLAGVLKMGVVVGSLWLLHALYPRSPRLVAAGVALVGVAVAVVLKLHADWMRLVGLLG